MADIVHDALLQESVGLFQDAISIVNTLALALAAERQSLTVTQALPPTAPLALSGALTLFGSLASTVPDMELQDKLSFPGDSIFSGALEIAGRARIVGDGTFGVDDEWRGSPTMSRAEALGAADVTVRLRGGKANLVIDGEAALAVGALLAGNGAVKALEGWLIDGARRSRQFRRRDYLRGQGADDLGRAAHGDRRHGER